MINKTRMDLSIFGRIFYTYDARKNAKPLKRLGLCWIMLPTVKTVGYVIKTVRFCPILIPTVETMGNDLKTVRIVLDYVTHG